jgi:hypothetical protein
MCQFDTENDIVTYVSDCGRGLDWWLNLLTAYKHNL